MAKPMRMTTRRFLFLEPRRKATPVPIYIALLGLLALGMLGLLAAAWVPSPGPTAQRPADRAPHDNSRSFEGSYLPPPAPSRPPRSGTWM